MQQPELVASFESLPDLALRSVGGSVIAANDETFAEKENLIKAAAPTFAAYTFGHKGQVMDGWETRRRREAGHDWAIVRLGMPGVVRGVVVDTAFFTGNYPPECSLEAAFVDPLGVQPDPHALADAHTVEWTELLTRSSLRGNSRHAFDVAGERLVTHVRLRIFPDGGVARLRVHGEPVGDPRWLAARSFDLAGLEHGARVLGASNRFYSDPSNALVRGPARVMGEGWETARRRDDGNDWFEVVLATEGVVQQVEVDTSHFIGNAPGEVRLRGRRRAGEWVEIIARCPAGVDTRHRFVVTDQVPVDTLRLDIYPDGGLARLRTLGTPTPEGRAALFARWCDRLSETQALVALRAFLDADQSWARLLVAARPLTDAAGVAAAVAKAAAGGPSPDEQRLRGLFG
ncbi:MAG: allantoicase [Candidatus Nanopelagicales bacterium]